MFLTIAFYHFVNLENIVTIREHINKFCQDNQIKGTILLATEGINGTISGKENNIQKFLIFIKENEYFNKKFNKLKHKESWATENPFYRMKVRIKKEIVTLGIRGINPSKKVGKYVSPQDWNKLISDPETTVIDTRNSYEVDIGTFKNAINPRTETFREFPGYINTHLNPKKK